MRPLCRSVIREMNPRTIQMIVSTVLLAIVCVIGQGATANADINDLTVDTGCTSVPSYTAKLGLEPGVYDVYAQLGRRGEKAKVTLYSQGPEQSYGTCNLLGKSLVEGNTWKKFNQVKVVSEGTYVLQFASASMANVPDANRPSVMLVPHRTPAICNMTDECYVNVFGQRAYLRPTGTLLNENSLLALVVTDPANDAVREVRYYVGKSLVYTSPKLEPFDTRYFEYAGQPLTRVVAYDSGQQAVIDAIVPLTHQDTFFNFLFRLSQRYPDTLKAINTLVLGLILSFAAFIGIGIIRRNQVERAHHGLRSRTLQLSVVQWARNVGRRYRIPTAVQLLAGGLAVVMALGVIIIGVNSYLLQIVTVSGRSMESSYSTGDSVLVNKLPKTLASLNNREYLPNRGDVVIVRASFGNTIFSKDDTTNTTLIKRVIGLPNERVIIKNGVLTVYNQIYPKGFQPDTGSTWESSMTKDPITENIDIVLGSSEIFVSGDNRPESIDSRFNGPLATREIIGVVIAKW